MKLLLISERTMSKALADNVAGHRMKYDILTASLSPDEAGAVYVGGGDPVVTGYKELEIIRSFRSIHNASIIDIGCGIGRLTQHLVHIDPFAHHNSKHHGAIIGSAGVNPPSPVT
jgi:2-polyprenyl-3-methyl-5-hydroxy-6-metoxy-1,4-benzoquinol methylase